MGSWRQNVHWMEMIVTPEMTENWVEHGIYVMWYIYIVSEGYQSKIDEERGHRPKKKRFVTAIRGHLRIQCHRF